MNETHPVRVTVNGTVYEQLVEPRMLLTDFLRITLGLTGTHVGCEHGVCGACTILLDGNSARACLLLAVQTDGCRVETVESLGSPEQLGALQQAFQSHHGLQCGFCTPGMLMTCVDMLRKYPLSTDEEIRHALSGNLCRCTGYDHIVAAVRSARDALRGASTRNDSSLIRASPLAPSPSHRTRVFPGSANNDWSTSETSDVDRGGGSGSLKRSDRRAEVG
jgi:aerobic carbon-monoxide dehydrogenase small subunit